MNDLLWFAALFLDFALLLTIYRFAGRVGIFSWIVMMTVLANIQVVKVVPLFGFTATLGNAAYASIFLASNVLAEHYSRRDARLAVKLGFFAQASMMMVMTLSLCFKPDESDFAHGAMKTLFQIMPRLLLASVMAYCISQRMGIFLYEFIRDKFPGVKFLWLRNNASTMIAQFVDTAVFATVAFYGLFPLKVFLSIIGTTYGLKFLAALLDTPFLYCANWMFRKGWIPEDGK